MITSQRDDRRRAAHAAGQKFLLGLARAKDYSRHTLRTQEEVARIMGLTAERVRQLEASAFNKIRQALGPFVA